MILPIVAYGDPVLKKRATEISKDYPNLEQIIANMYETMYGAHGVGLAAPQVGLSIRLFLVDTAPFSDDDSYTPEEQAELNTFKRTFINAKILEESGEEWNFNEGCLSFPDLRFDVDRNERIRIKYLDRDFKPHDEVYDGISARIIQHEYDHVEGILFTDKLSYKKRKSLKEELNLISSGNIEVKYKMSFFKK